MGTGGADENGTPGGTAGNDPKTGPEPPPGPSRCPRTATRAPAIPHGGGAHCFPARPSLRLERAPSPWFG
ncbi:hypothetical protein Aut01nite_78480 [Actinoplanes utahensis]|nr:hypothetical protein Aut01nite_78480 [Actinoplanes utahensis]